MDVTSLIVAWSLMGQAAPDPFRGAPPAAMNAVAPATVAPSSAPSPTSSSGSPPAGLYAPPSGDRYDRYAPAANTGGSATTAGSNGGAFGTSNIVPVAGSERMPAENAVPGGRYGTTGTMPPTSTMPPGSLGGTSGTQQGFSSSPAAITSGDAVTAPRSALPDPMRAATSASPAPSVAAPSSPSQPLREAGTMEPRSPAPTRAAVAPTEPPPAAEDNSGAAELVRDALVLPKSLPVAGKPTTLLETLSRVADRRRQTAAVYAYWKLAGETGEYHYAWQHVQFLKLLDETAAGIEQGADAQAARTAVAARHAEAQAEWREAELRLAAAQAELLEASGSAADAERPLASDLPHVGVYNTSFERVYARRAPPARAYLLQKTLPVRRDVMTGRAQTVWAAQDAYEAAFDAYRKRQLPLDDVLTAIAALRDRRSQFLTAVRRYNDEIAEYALTSAPEGTSRETLVGMLIKSEFTPKLGRAVFPADLPGADTEFAVPVGFEEYEGAIPAEFAPGQVVPSGGATTLEPVPDAGISGNAPGSYFGATPAAYVDGTSAESPVPSVAVPTNTLPQQASYTTATASVPYAAPNLLDVPDARPIPIAAPQNVTTVPQANGSAPMNYQRGTPTLAPPREPNDAPLKFKVNRAATDEPGLLPENDEARPLPAAGKTPYSSGTGSDEAAGSSASSAMEGKPRGGPTLAAPHATDGAQHEVLSGKSRDDAVEPAGFYDAVAGLPSPRRTQQLVEQLYESATAATEESVEPITLDQCLSAAGGTSRSARIAAYWATAEAAAARQVWTQKLAQLDALSQATLRFRESPAGAAAMLEVHAARLAAQASQREATAELLAARWRLSDELHRRLAEPWATAVTVPHGGSYDTKLESLSSESPLRRKLQPTAELLADLHEILQYRADAVAAGDQASEGALRRYAAGQCPVAVPLEEFRLQTASTVALLAATTRYNREIADYALRLLPSRTPSSTLVSALVIHRAARAER